MREDENIFRRIYGLLSKNKTMFKLLLLCYLVLSLVVMPEHKAQALKLREFGECSDAALRRMGCTIRCIDDDGVDMHVLEPGVALAAVRKCVEVDCVDRWSQECDKKYKYAFAKNVSFRIAGSMGLGVLDALGLEPAWEKVKDMSLTQVAEYLKKSVPNTNLPGGEDWDRSKKLRIECEKIQRATSLNLSSNARKLKDQGKSVNECIELVAFIPKEECRKKGYVINPKSIKDTCENIYGKKALPAILAKITKIF